MLRAIRDFEVGVWGSMRLHHGIAVLVERSVNLTFIINQIRSGPKVQRFSCISTKIHLSDLFASKWATTNQEKRDPRVKTFPL